MERKVNMVVKYKAKGRLKPSRSTLVLFNDLSSMYGQNHCKWHIVKQQEIVLLRDEYLAAFNSVFGELMGGENKDQRYSKVIEQAIILKTVYF